MTDNTAPVQRQLDAYNAKDLAAFISCYHSDIAIYRMPATEPALIGHDALEAFYKTERFTIAALHAEVLQRMVVGNKVIDHEVITCWPGFIDKASGSELGAR